MVKYEFVEITNLTTNLTTANTDLNIDDYSLPKIEDIFASFEREYLPKLDLKKPYLQILVNSNL